MDERIDNVVSDILGNAGNNLVQSLSTKTLDDVTFHDFAQYQFLLDPMDFPKIDITPLSPHAVAYINDLENSGASVEILEYMADLLTRLEAHVKRAFLDGLGEPVHQVKASILKPTIGVLQLRVLQPLYTLHRNLIRRMVDFDLVIPYFFKVHIYEYIKKQAKDIRLTIESNLPKVFDDTQGSIYEQPPLDWIWLMLFMEHNVFKDLNIENAHLTTDLEYPFYIYPPSSVNIGIALVYRQRWKALGTQPGEIVKTVPLGPGQSEKIMTKITRRRKTSSTTETSVESETTNETNDTTKDSTEVVKEAASNENWSLSASASYGIGGLGFGASLSGKMGGSKENSSKNTTSGLSEMMKKTASKLRRQTKISVSTEVKTGFEETTTSEVKNTNDEVALTLQYHMLQHQYDVYTYLFSVKNCIFVAEKVPAPFEVNITWVRRYDWIIAEELLDDSFRKTLNDLIQDEDIDALITFGDAADPYSKMLHTANDTFAGFTATGSSNGFGGLDVPDIYAEPQRQYDQFRKEEETRRRANKIRDIQRSRLFDHIKDNVLHYCRAIWAREDAEQRILRYKKEGRTVPFIWNGPLLPDGDDAAQFEPTEVRISIDEIIHEITPIGFTGNYVVFGLANADFDSEDMVELNVNTPDGVITLPLQEVLNIIRSAYTDSNGTGLRDPALDFFVGEAEKLSPDALTKLPDGTVFDFISFLPHLTEELINQEQVIRNDNETLSYSISIEEWGEYLFKKNATRRFLVDSNNLYVSMVLGDGVALEPFKRAHRFIDVLTADEERKTEVLKNERRDLLKSKVNHFDPDISKVVIATGSKTEDLVSGVLAEEGESTDT